MLKKSQKLKNRIILQIRSNSKRLPLKSLRKIGGTPLGLICAKRLTNIKNDFIIASSNKKTDDKLCKIFKKNKMKVYRGNLEDVLSRYYNCTLDLNSSDTITRVTGDNIFPDGKFIKKALEIFYKKKLDFLFCKSPLNNLPYGLSVEIFKVKNLRLAYKRSHSKFDREHVTPWIFRNTNNKDNLTNCDLNLINLSKVKLSIDTEKDFKKLNGFLKKIKIKNKELFSISWYDLLNKYYLENFQKKNKLIIGSANFNNKYGYNKSFVKENEIKKIFTTAKNSKVNRFDTAYSYNNAEKYFKNKHQIIDTKLALNKFVKGKDISLEIYKKLNISFNRLGQKINTIIFHDWDQYVQSKREIYRIIKKKFKNRYNKFGISIYHPHQLHKVIKDKNIGYIQFPLSILDQRFFKSMIIKLFSKNKRIEICIRSIFLQGIILKKINSWPNFKRKKIIYSKINKLVNVFRLKDKLELCLFYSKSFDWVNNIILGIDNNKQLKEILTKYNNNLIFQFSEKNIQYINKQFKDLSKLTILPYMWKKNV